MVRSTAIVEEIKALSFTLDGLCLIRTWKIEAADVEV
jgi:hypothetical protein